MRAIAAAGATAKPSVGPASAPPTPARSRLTGECMAPPTEAGVSIPEAWAGVAPDCLLFILSQLGLFFYPLVVGLEASSYQEETGLKQQSKTVLRE